MPKFINKIIKNTQSKKEATVPVVYCNIKIPPLHTKTKNLSTMSQRTKAQEALGIRLADILTRLNQGETIDIQSLPERYGISLRTAQRDLNRLAPLLQTTGTRYYRLDQNQYGRLNKR